MNDIQRILPMATHYYDFESMTFDKITGYDVKSIWLDGEDDYRLDIDECHLSDFYRFDSKDMRYIRVKPTVVTLSGIKDTETVAISDQYVDFVWETYGLKDPTALTAAHARALTKHHTNRVDQFVDYWLLAIKRMACHGKSTCTYTYLYTGSYCYQTKSLNRLVELGYRVDTSKVEQGIKVIVSW